MKITSRLVLLCLAVFITLPGNARAMGMPGFDLDTGAGEAVTIFLGTLHRDGSFSATKILKGPSQLPRRFEIEQGTHWSRTYAGVMGVEGEPEIIAFVQESPLRETPRNSPVSIYFVAVSPAGKIFGRFQTAFSDSGSTLRAHEFWTKDLFLSQLEQSIAAANRLNFILAAPPSPARVDRLLEFLKADLPRRRAQLETGVEAANCGSEYLFYQAAAGLRNPSQGEEFSMAGLLQQPQPGEDLARLLAVVAKVRPSDLLYRRVLPHAEPDRSGVVRREAFTTLAALDPYAAAGDLAKFLKLDEPELRPVLLTLSLCAQGREPKLLNAAVLEPIGKLGPLILEESRGPYSHEKTNRLNYMISVLDLYHHPSNLPLLMGGFDDEPLGPGRPTRSQFRTMTALGHNPEEGGQLPGWWAKYRQLLQQPYNLRSTQGLEAWLKAFDGTDGKWAKGMLLRLWVFEPVIPEADLLRACHGPNPNAAKALLAELWQRKRISVETRVALITEYLKLRIVEEPAFPYQLPKVRNLKIITAETFPFPEAACFNTKEDLAVDREPVITAESSGASVSLGMTNPQEIMTRTQSEPGSAKALVDLWEMDYQADPSKELWRLRWKLDQANNASQPPIQSEGK